MIRIAATGDLHFGTDSAGMFRREIEGLGERADMLLLAGDLTRLGDPREAEVLAREMAGAPVPVIAVLGNHDYHSDRHVDVSATLADAGVVVLERSSTIVRIEGVTVGVAGVKGFVGGFGRQWANFGEPLFRQAYAETTADVEALDAALRAIAGADLRVALLHYAPTAQTLEGEPKELWLVLGAERLATPIAEHRPDLVLHGHAHAGSPNGEIDGVPVHNVAVHVTGETFAVFTLGA